MKLTGYKLLALTLFASGCTHYYYSPNKVNLPGLRDRNDARLEGGIGKGLLMVGADVQTSVAMGEHVGIMINGALTKSSNEWETEKYRRTKSAFLEAGFGYFNTLGEDKRWLFEVYGGGGGGKYWLGYDARPAEILTSNSFFVQPSLVFSKGEHLELGMGARLRGVDFTGLIKPASSTYSNFDINQLIDGPMQVLFEPVFRFGVGSEKVKFYFTYTPSLGLSDKFVRREVMIFGTGVRYTFKKRRAENERRAFE